MNIRVLLLLSAISFSAQSTKKFFYTQQVLATIDDRRLVEASGIEESYENPGYFWTHNDSGSEPTLYLINNRAQIVMEVDLKGLKNRDWEEIVTVKKDGESYIYVAEIGDNKAVHKDVKILKIPEPRFNGKQNITIDKKDVEIMSFTYAEGARDAEAVLYDQNQDEFVLVTKREKNALVYSFPFKANKKPVTIKSKGKIPTKLFTAADMNEKGEILLKHYSAIFYWGPSQETAIDRILAWDASMVDYVPEPQGEAICWYKDDFYTISEKNIGKPQEMLFFKRVP
ncbi:hypothetical protein [Ekhidna sp. To15]|uniref:hypothetical protein n=1 Tax=Ekhidna sp. To15 TaxID=3395267 RepID=UPI003F528FF6